MFQRTVDPGVTLFTAAEIRVVILPVGQVPRDVADGYTEAISRFRHMSLSATRSFYREPPQKTPFGYMDWSNGYMHFRYMQVEDARRKSRISDLHRQRQVVAVLGMVYCPTCPSVQQAYEDFSRTCRALFPEALVQRCFVFEPSEDQIRQDYNHLKNLVVLPPGGLVHLEQHLEVWMHDLAALVLTELERAVQGVTPATMRMGGGCYADSAEFTGSNAVIEEVTKRLTLIDDDEVREKRRWARLMKAKGDMCLMAGTPQDAADHYRSAADLARSSNDLVWYGAAVEGMASARLMQALMAGASGGSSSSGSGVGPERGGAATSPSSSPAGGAGGAQGGASSGSSEGAGGADRRLTRKPSVDHTRRGAGGHAGYGHRGMWDALRSSGCEAELRDLLADARGAYKKRGGVPALSVELHLKLARLVAGLRGAAAARREVLELGGLVQDTAPALPALEDRMTAVAEAAQVVGMVGSPRKRMLLLWHALELARSAPLPPPAPVPGGNAQAIQQQQLAVAQERADLLLRLAAKLLEPPEDPRDCLPAGPGAGAGVGVSGERLTALVQALSGGGMAAGGASQGQGQAGSSSGAKGGSAAAAAGGASGNGAAGAKGSRWAHKPWDTVRCAVLEAALSAARQLGAAVDAWEAAAALLRDHGTSLLLSQQASLVDAMQAAAGAMQPHMRVRPGKGPGPLVQLRRVLPAPPPLQPTRMGAAGKGKASPFIFNPYTAKRELAASSGEAELLIPDWVCNDDCRVEVVLTNPLSVPLRLDQLHLHVRYSAPEAGTAAAAAAAAIGGGTGATSSSGAAGSSGAAHATQQAGGPEAQRHRAGGQSFWQPYPVQLLLPPGGKPVRVVLAGRTLLPGKLTLLGVKVTAAGVTWTQPFGPPAQRKAAGAGAGSGAGAAGGSGRQGGSSRAGAGGASGGRAGKAGAEADAGASGEVCVTVLPPLPLLQATLRGPDVTLMAPTQDELHPAGSGPAGQGPGGIGGSSFSGGALGLGAGGPGGLGKDQIVSVFEGQVQSWSLVLSNISTTPLDVASCQLAVANARGTLLKPLPHGHLRASFVGAHMELDDRALAGALPLAPGKSVSLPVELHVGRRPADAFEEMVLEVRVTYSGSTGAAGASSTPATTATSATMAVAPAPAGAAGEGAPATAGPAAAPAVLFGRRMALPIHFRIQPTLAISGLSFLEYYSPLRDGSRCTRPHLLHAATAAGASGGSIGGDTLGADADGLGLGYGPVPEGSLPDALMLRERSEPMLGQVQGLLLGKGPGSLGSVGAAGAGAGAAGLGHISSSRMAGLALDLALPARMRDPQRARLNRTRSFEFDADTPLEGALDLSLSSLNQGAGSAGLPKPHTPGSASSAARNLSAAFGSAHDSVSTPTGSPGADAGFGSTQGGALAALTPVATHGGGGGGGGLGLEGMRLGLACDCVVSVQVANRSDRYFRVWLGRVADTSDGATPGVESVQEVLQPGGSTRLLACLQHALPGSSTGSSTSDLLGAQPGGAAAPGPASPRAGQSAGGAGAQVEGGSGGAGSGGPSLGAASGGAAAAGGPGAAAGPKPLPEEPDRMAAAEALSDGWAVCWQMITAAEGAAAAAAPKGVVRLAAVDVARSMTHAAASVLQPPPLHFSLSAVAVEGSSKGGLAAWAAAMEPGSSSLQGMSSDPPAAAAAGEGDAFRLGGGTGMGPGMQQPALPRLARLKNVAGRVAAMGGLRAHQGVGELWSMRLGVGEAMDVELVTTSRAPQPVHASFSVAVTSLQPAWGPEGPSSPGGGGGGGGFGGGLGQRSAAQQQHPYLLHSGTAGHGAASFAAGGGGGAGAYSGGHSLQLQHSSHAWPAPGGLGPEEEEDLIDPGVVVVGRTHNVHIGLMPNSSHTHRLVLVALVPGFYQLHITNVLAMPLDPAALLSAHAAARAAAAAAAAAAMAANPWAQGLYHHWASGGPPSPLHSAGPSGQHPSLSGHELLQPFGTLRAQAAAAGGLGDASGDGGIQGPAAAAAAAAGTGAGDQQQQQQDGEGLQEKASGAVQAAGAVAQQEAIAEQLEVVVARGWAYDSKPQRVYVASDKLNMLCA